MRISGSSRRSSPHVSPGPSRVRTSRPLLPRRKHPRSTSRRSRSLCVFLTPLLAACHEVSGPPIHEGPPDTATVRRLTETYQNLESDQMQEWESTIGMPVGLYTQHVAGIQAQPQRFDLYQFLAVDADPGFQSIVMAVTNARKLQTLGTTIH